MLVEALLDAHRHAPNADAVHDPFRKVTFGKLTLLARVFRDIVREQTERENVGLLLPGGVGFDASFFGTLWAGKVAVPLNFLLSPEELSGIIEDAGIDLVLSAHVFDETTRSIPARTLCLEDLPLKRRAILAKLRSVPPAPKVDPDDLAVLLYTSGTSGTCKGVELSSRNLSSNCDAIIDAIKLTSSDRFLCVLPPFHVFGLTGNVIVPVVLRIPTRVIPRFSPAAVLRAIKESNPTVFMAIPSMYGALLRTKSAPADAFAGVRMCLSGGEPLPERIADGFRDRFGVELLEGYGMTETSPVISINSPEHNKPGSVGKPIPGVQVRLVEGDGAEAVQTGVGEEGEILVRSPGVMRGYRNRAEETAQVLSADGWLATGDIGTIDDDGFLSITGRKKDIMIVGGENVFPREIEAALEQHPAVAEAAVIGVPDESRGEVPLAFVSLKEDQDATDIELRSFARERLAGYKVPKQIRLIDELPHGPTGKVLKRKLRESLEQTA
jgi:long-chain acyl-CoA synthetase